MKGNSNHVVKTNVQNVDHSLLYSAVLATLMTATPAKTYCE
jgi:hypothetical protein